MFLEWSSIANSFFPECPQVLNVGLFYEIPSERSQRGKRRQIGKRANKRKAKGQGTKRTSPIEIPLTPQKVKSEARCHVMGFTKRFGVLITFPSWFVACSYRKILCKLYEIIYVQSSVIAERQYFFPHVRTERNERKWRSDFAVRPASRCILNWNWILLARQPITVPVPFILIVWEVYFRGHTSFCWL